MIQRHTPSASAAVTWPALAIRRWYPWLVVAQVLLLLAAIGLTVLVKQHPAPFSFDPAGDRAVQDALLPHSRLSGFVEWFSTINWPIPSAITVAAVLAVLLLLRQKLAAPILLGGILLADGSNYLASQIVRRPRPSGHGIHVMQSVRTSFSFPSGHVEHVYMFYGFLLWLTFQIRRPGMGMGMGMWVWPTRVVLLVVLSLIAPSRLLEGEHWTTDVLGGIIFGCFWLVGAISVYHWLWYLREQRSQEQEATLEQKATPSQGALWHTGSERREA